jgi:hypothetical protein
MMHAKPEVVLFDSDERSAMEYSAVFGGAGVQLFKVAYLPAGGLLREPGFDAVYWPLVGAERWNVRPVEDTVQLIRTGTEDAAEGWPQYVLVGLALSAPNAVDVETGFKTWARALLTAVGCAPDPGIARIKVPSEMVRLSELAPTQAAAILAEVERECAR